MRATSDGVIGRSSSPGRVWAWQTRSWSGGQIYPAAVLYQRVIDTASNPGPVVGGIRVDVNDVLAISGGGKFGAYHHRFMFGSVAGYLAEKFGTKGSPISLSTACASGATAIQLGVSNSSSL